MLLNLALKANSDMLFTIALKSKKMETTIAVAIFGKAIIIKMSGTKPIQITM